MTLAMEISHYRRMLRKSLPSTNFKFNESSWKGKINVNWKVY